MNFIYQKEKDRSCAEKLQLEAFKGYQLKLGDIHPYTKESLNELIGLYDVWNKPEKPMSVEQNWHS